MSTLTLYFSSTSWNLALSSAMIFLISGSVNTLLRYSHYNIDNNNKNKRRRRKKRKMKRKRMRKRKMKKKMMMKKQKKKEEQEEEEEERVECLGRHLVTT